MAIPNQSHLREFVRAFGAGQPLSDKALLAAVELVRAHLQGRRKKGRPLKNIAGRENRRVLAAILDIAVRVEAGETKESALRVTAEKYHIGVTTLRRYWKQAESSLIAMGDPDLAIAFWPTLGHVIAGRTNPLARKR